VSRPAGGLLCVVLALALGIGPAEATILIFDERLPDTPTSNNVLVPQAYGDNVAGSPQGGFTYGLNGEGFTPNVVVGYGPPSVLMWTTDYGNLTNVIYRQTGGILDLTLTADPGYRVLLYSFDMAGWLKTDYTINAVQVFDGANSSLFGCFSCAIEGTSGHTAFSFSDPLTSQVLRIHFDATNLGGLANNIGLDNVRFGQAVPEPPSLLLLGSGLAGLAAWRRRRRP
jgi:hypothetical protein